MTRYLPSKQPTWAEIFQRDCDALWDYVMREFPESEWPERFMEQVFPPCSCGQKNRLCPDRLPNFRSTPKKSGTDDREESSNRDKFENDVGKGVSGPSPDTLDQQGVRAGSKDATSISGHALASQEGQQGPFKFAAVTKVQAQDTGLEKASGLPRKSPQIRDLPTTEIRPQANGTVTPPSAPDAVKSANPEPSPSDPTNSITPKPSTSNSTHSSTLKASDLDVADGSTPQPSVLKTANGNTPPSSVLKTANGSTREGSAPEDPDVGTSRPSATDTSTANGSTAKPAKPSIPETANVSTVKSPVLDMANGPTASVPSLKAENTSQPQQEAATDAVKGSGPVLALGHCSEAHHEDIGRKLSKLTLEKDDLNVKAMPSKLTAFSISFDFTSVAEEGNTRTGLSGSALATPLKDLLKGSPKASLSSGDVSDCVDAVSTKYSNAETQTLKSNRVSPTSKPANETSKPASPTVKQATQTSEHTIETPIQCSKSATQVPTQSLSPAAQTSESAFQTSESTTQTIECTNRKQLMPSRPSLRCAKVASSSLEAQKTPIAISSTEIRTKVLEGTSYPRIPVITNALKIYDRVTGSRSKENFIGDYRQCFAIANRSQRRCCVWLNNAERDTIAMAMVKLDTCFYEEELEECRNAIRAFAHLTLCNPVRGTCGHKARSYQILFDFERESGVQLGLTLDEITSWYADFEPWEPNWSISLDRVQCVHGLRRRSLDLNLESDSGFIYACHIPGVFERLEIRHARNIEERMKEMQTHCGYMPVLTLVSAKAVPYVARVTRLIHTELKDHRRVQKNCKCAVKHREWFELDTNKVRFVMERWLAWIDTEPYESIGYLKPDAVDPFEPSKQLTSALAKDEAHVRSVEKVSQFQV